MNDNLKNLWNTLKKSGYNPPDFDAFAKDMQDEGNLKRVHETLKREGYTPPQFETFKADMGYKVAAPAAVAPAATQKVTPIQPVAQPGQGTKPTKPISMPKPKPGDYEVMQSNVAAADTMPIDSLKPLGSGKGYQTRHQPTADELQRQKNEKATREQVAQMSDDINARILKRGNELDDNADNSFFGNMMRGGGIGATPSYVTTNNKRKTDPEYKALEAAALAINDSKALIAEADKAQKEGNFKGFVKGAGRGFGNKLFDVRTWDSGLTEGVAAGTILTALQKADKGEALTDAEKTLLDAKAVELATNAYFGSYVGRGYKAGQVTAESIPFMIEMCINPASKAGTSAESMLTRYALKRFGKKAALEAFEKGGEGATKQAFKALGKKEAAKIIAGRVAGDVAGATTMTATTGLNRVVGDTFGRASGDIQFKTDEETGKSAYDGHTEGDSLGTAFAKAFAGTTIENYSEMFGEYFDPLKAVAGKAVRKGLNKIHLGGVNDFIDNVAASDVAKVISDFEENAHWSGSFSEYAEEVAGSIMNALIVGDQTFDTDENTGIFNLDNNIDTFLGVALMGGFMSMAKTAGYRTPKYNARKAMEKADSNGASLFANQDLWGQYRNTIAFGNDEEVKGAIANALANEDLTQEQKQAVLDYAKNVETYKGMQKGEQSKRSEQAGTPEVDAEQSYENGYTLEDAEEKQDASMMYENQRQKVTDALGEDLLGMLDENPLQALREIAARPDMNEEDKQLALDYVNAKATYDGMIDKVRDDIEGQVEASDKEIDSRTNKQSGNIVSVKLKNDQEAYVVDGVIAMTDDGTAVDIQNSSESILIRDKETGKIEFTSPSNILSADAPIDANEEKQKAADAIRDAVAQQASDEIDGTLAFQPNDQYNLLDGNGNPITATIVQDNGDGTVMASFNGSEAQPVAKETIQQFADNAKQARLAQFEAEKQAQQQAETPEPVNGYGLNDEFMLNIDGKLVRGSIEQMPDEEGKFGVWTEDAVNGSKYHKFTADELDVMTGKVEAPVQEAAPIAEGEAPAQAEQAQEAMPMNADETDYDYATAGTQRTSQFLSNEEESGLTSDEADDFISDKIKEAEKALNKANSKKSKNTNLLQRKRENEAIKGEIDAAQTNLDFWNNVKNERENIKSAPAVGEESAENAGAPVISSAPEVGTPVAPVSNKAEEKETGKTEKEAKEPVEAPKANAPQAPTEESKVDKAKRLLDEMDEAEKMDNDEEANRIYGEYGKLVKELTDDEVEEIGNYIDEKNYEEEAFVADRLEGIYARRAQAHAAEIKQQMEEQQKKLVPLFKKLLAAMKGNFKKDIAAAKKEIEAELRNCNHMHLQIIMTHADATRKANKGKAEGKTATEIGKIAKMVVSDLYKQLGGALGKVNPDVRIDYSNGGFWLSGAKGTTLYDAFEAGGNSDRWIHEYNEQYAGTANTLDPLSPDNIADWVKHIKGVIEDYVSDYEKEQGKKDAIQKRLDAGNADAVRPADGWSDTELNLVKDEDARKFSTVEEDAPYSDASIIKLIKDRINDAITSETDEASVAEAKEALDWLESRGEDVTELRNQYNQKYGIKETSNYGLEQSEETGKLDNETQKMLDSIGRALNVTIKVERRGEDFNGEWDPNTRTITINADKVTNSPETTLETIFGHELTHVIKEASADVPELWNAYVKFVKAVVGEEKYNDVFSEYQEHYTGLFKEGKLDTMPTDADIDEEVCAQFGGVAFVNAKQDAIQELVDTAIEESGKGTFIVKKVLESINNALRKLEAFLKGKKDPKYRVVQENLANARDTWGAMLVYAIEKEQKKNRDLNTATSGAGLIEGGNNVRKGVKLSVSSNIEGAGFETSYTGENDVKQALTNERGDMVIKMGDKEFDAQHPVTVEDIKSNKNSILSYMMKDAIGLGAITDAQAEKIYNKYVALINYYLSEGSAEKGGPSNVTDKWQWLGESIFRTVATNGDSQYKYSIDITRICKKNEAIINSISEMQRQLRYGITPAQILDLYLQTVEADYQAPCPVCYVFSRYIRNGKYASAAINGMRKYGKHLPGQAEEWTVDQWVAELERLEEEKKELGSYISKANTDVTTIPGKIDDLGKIITDQSTSEEERNKLMQEVYALDKRYRKALDVVSQQSLTNWIKTFAIQSKESKYIMREDAKMPEDMTDFEDHALDLRLTASAMVKYPAIQRLRKSGGAAAGKEITQASNNELGSISQALGKNKPESSVNWYQEAVNAKTAKERRKALKSARDRYKAALLYSKRQTLRGGQRMWSWSDNIERLSNDVAINLIQEEMLSGAVQSYSKQLEGIKLVASMGAYVNGSLMGKGLGYREVNAEDIEEVDGQKVVKGGSFSFDITNKKGETKTITLQAPVYEQDGKFYTLEFDPVVGIDAFGGIGEDGEKKKGLFQLNATLDKAGNILVGMNDIHCKAAMADNRVFFIIPWHASGMSSHVLTQMINFLGTEFDAKLAIDYTDMQEEKDYFKKSEGEYPEIPSRMVAIWEEVKNETDWKSGIGAIPSGNGEGKLSEAQKRYRRLRDAILKGVEITVTDKKGNPKTRYVPVEMYDNMMKQIKADEFLKQVYAKTRAVVGKESMTTDDCDHIYPYEYWDESSTFETAGINGKRYLEYCRRLGFKPKFCGRFKAAEGSDAANQGNFIHEEGYWKTLIDRRMYDTEGKFQDLTVVDSEGFDPTMIDPEETKKEFVVTKVADEEGVKRIVDATKQMEIERSGDIADVNYDLTMREAVDRYNDNEAEATKGKKLSALDDSGLADIVSNAEKLDKQYMEAVKNEDYGQLKQMVEAAAKDAGYTQFLMHGTNKGGFKVIDLSKSDDGISFFMSDDAEVANTYTDDYENTIDTSGEEGQHGIMELYAKFDNPFVIDAATNSWYQIPVGEDPNDEISRMEFSIQPVDPNDIYDGKVRIEKMSDMDEGPEQLEFDNLKEALNYLHEHLNDYSVEDLRQRYLNADHTGNLNTWQYIEVAYNQTKDRECKTMTTREIARQAYEQGHDGVIIKDVFDNGGVGDQFQWDPANVFIAFEPNKVKSAEPVTYDDEGKVIPLSKRFNEEEEDLRFSLLDEDTAETEDDKKAIEAIKNGETKTVYRSMQVVEIDGKRYALPPMASKIDGKWVMGVLIHDDGTMEPQLLKSDEHPELAKNGKFYLDKGNNKGLWAAYNPYWHTSPMTEGSSGMLNDQFSEAQSRPNLITVEGVVPTFELTSGYKAEKAKDDVGEKEWKAGIIQGQMSGKRRVILSRYFQGVRVVPDAEVAQNIFNDINGKVDYMPTNVVPPAVRAELEKLGVKFVKTDNMNQLLEGEHVGDRFTWWYGKNPEANRRSAFRERAVAEYMHLADWLEKEGRTGQISPKYVENTDKKIDKSIELQKAKDAQKAEKEAIKAQKKANAQAKKSKKASKKSDTRERQAAPSVTYTKDTSRNYSRKKQAEYAQRQERRARQKIDDFCKKLHIDGIVTLLDDGSGLKGKKARAKGWFDVRTGKITIVLGNHSSLGDVMKTILHESVAHYGLRKLFGKNFDTFLDNTFQNADEDIRRQIVELAKKHKWNFRVATEEYLAKLAEDTEFDTAEHQEWWDKVKFFFYDMMKKLGIDGFKSDIIITDNELKYLLWRSYNGLTDPTRFKSYVGMAEDVVMQNELGVGNYEENTGNGEWSAAEDTLFRDADDADAEEPKTMSEQILDGLMQLSQRNADNVQLKLDILKSISAQISKLKKAARAQREYDKTTVDEMVGIARIMLANGYIDTMTAPEVKRLLLDIRNATGKEDIAKYAREMIKHLTDIQVKQAMKVFGSVIKIRGSKVNASGVEVQGTLDVKGQMFINAFRGAFGLSEQAIQDRIDDLTDKMADPNQMIAENAAIERGALTLALSYVQDVKMSLEEEKQLKQELKDAKEAKKAGTMDKDAYKQFVEATENALLQNKLERIEALRQLTGKLAGALRGSIQDAKEFREQEKQRVRNIQHYANSDMEGRPTDEHHKEDWKQKFMNNSFIRFFLKPLGTFDQMLRMFGNKNVNGEGYLYNHFMRKWLNASHNEFKKFKAATDVLDKKVSEVFGKKMRWSDLYALERKMGTVTVEFYDGGVKKSHELTQGNLLYMWMVNKMDDGAMKLAKMGITEADMKAVENMLDPRFKELANWIQEEFLVNKRNEYNEVHERLFGAPMANIDNYFPLKVLANARTENIEIADNNGSNALVSTVTGSVIKRRRNSLALDITGADAFSVVIEHIQQMEHWAAYAEFNKDINTLLSYKHFRNQVMNMSSVYGGGKKLWDNFKDVCKIASGVYRPISTSDSADKTFLNAAKGITAAKISFRIFTALKQFLSSPAYLAEANVINIGKSLATPWLSWNWAMQELPTFQKRWQSRQAGDSRLMDTDMDWRFWHNRMVETISRWGMSPNAFVDAMTVSIGAKAIYDTKLAQYLKDGYSQTKAEQKAKEDAAVLVNETQQSSEAAFMSTIQLDRTVASVALTVFRNSSMGYQRQFVDAIRSLKKMMTPGNRAKSIEFMTKQMVRDGLDDAQAKRAATRVYNHAAFRHLARVAVFGYIMQFAWNLGPYMAYLLMGDDDDEKDKMLEDAAQHALFGGLEGLSAGSILSEIANMMASGASFRNYEFNLLPMMADIQSIVTHFENDKVAGSNEIINLLLQSAIGMNPQTATDAAVAIYDACKGDPKTSKEATILIMRLLSMPKGQIEKIYIDELGLKGNEVKNYTVAQMAERYARYKKNAGAPLTQVFYSDPVEEAVVGKYIEKFEKKVKERVKASTGNKELDDAYQKYEEKFKEADKTYQSIMDLRTRDQSEFMRRMQDFSTTDEFRDYSLFKGYKNAIDNLFKTALNIQDPQKRDELLRQADEYKGKLVTELDKLHQ